MTNNAHAGVGDFLDALQAKKITYQVSVVDSEGKPVPYAVLWQVITYQGAGKFDPGPLMKRLTQRYAADADFVTHTRLHLSLLAYYADQNGQLELIAEAKAKADKDAGSMQVAIAALKRGYEPSFVSEETALNTTKSITIHLQPIPQFVPEPALTELDEIRGAVEASRKMGMQSPERAQVLSKAAARIRLLAERSEQSGKKDVAATLFHYLAYIPSINVLMDGNGKTVGIKVLNGYDDKDPRRRSDYEKSLALNSSNPQLLYERAKRNHPAVFTPPVHASDEQRKAFLADVEPLRQHFNDRLWPFDFQIEWKQYAEIGAYDKACEYLNRFYQFEPTYFNEEQWTRNMGFFTFVAKERGDTYACRIEGFNPTKKPLPSHSLSN